MNQNIFYVQYIFAENRAVDEIKWKIMIEPEKVTDNNIIWRIRIVCWITKLRIHKHTLNI
jgi:hypothetical protein